MIDIDVNTTNNREGRRINLAKTSSFIKVCLINLVRVGSKQKSFRISEAFCFILVVIVIQKMSKEIFFCLQVSFAYFVSRNL